MKSKHLSGGLLLFSLPEPPPPPPLVSVRRPCFTSLPEIQPAALGLGGFKTPLPRETDGCAHEGTRGED